MSSRGQSSLAAAAAGGAAAGALLVLAVQRLQMQRSQQQEREVMSSEKPEAADVPDLDEVSSSSSDCDISCGSLADCELRKLDMDMLNATVLSEKEASAEECVRWALEEFGERLVMSTSFGMQSAVLLHMVTKVVPNIPVIWIDTGYLHKETYHFAEHLVRRLNLNLKVYQSDISAARMEALHGQLWDRDDEASHRVYGVVRKVEPMARALKELDAEAMLSGVRGKQTTHRSGLGRITLNHAQKHYRIHPLLHWSQQDVDDYLAKHNLPYHPLKRKGYVSIGDKHSTKPLSKTNNSTNEAANRNTRFGGKRQECGLHTENANVAELKNVVSSLSLQQQGQQQVQAQQQLTPHGNNNGIEIYGRANCRFCKASKRVLEAKNVPYTWYTLQRYDQKKHTLEPLQCNEFNSCVTRDVLEHRFENAAPGLPPFETVPQIFHNGEYVGGFTELCSTLQVPKNIMDIAILDIGGNANIERHNANSWNGISANNRVNASVLKEDFFHGPPTPSAATPSRPAPTRSVSAPIQALLPPRKNNSKSIKAEPKLLQKSRPAPGIKALYEEEKKVEHPH
uniref:Uncharacterized protein n=1 Tax=Helicotheca tamesis TaxID=374047 RepID=A0A7S2DZ26_9STRA|mmetsp:Transcript_10499/g.14716  ORF Transcript_10499/g.14716 Transcript_10499/m.14716 type:complete len:567 (+) Transcript_10499:125-1825(+)|eukprot:CAMPEP_0185725388 /NCGR_PEP_ID=MMETSP1171-20130828/1658_1 /TAXON_ID=374046 /ORGANISM="Helicotheca tamensis, Strain CCMP826" /LENGTH=566 /DNA_ID=CAMNT_0028393505 /DNA_START=101 /DNA_END=1801 /DNA_ORIENTATION=-